MYDERFHILKKNEKRKIRGFQVGQINWPSRAPARLTRRAIFKTNADGINRRPERMINHFATNRLLEKIKVHTDDLRVRMMISCDAIVVCGSWKLSERTNKWEAVEERKKKSVVDLCLWWCMCNTFFLCEFSSAAVAIAFERTLRVCSFFFENRWVHFNFWIFLVINNRKSLLLQRSISVSSKYNKRSKQLLSLRITEVCIYNWFTIIAFIEILKCTCVCNPLFGANGCKIIHVGRDSLFVTCTWSAHFVIAI